MEFPVLYKDGSNSDLWFRLVEEIRSGFEDAEQWPERGGFYLVVVGLLVLILVVILVVKLIAVLVGELIVKARLGVASAVGNDVRDVAVCVIHALVRRRGCETSRCNNKNKCLDKATFKTIL